MGCLFVEVLNDSHFMIIHLAALYFVNANSTVCLYKHNAWLCLGPNIFLAFVCLCARACAHECKTKKEKCNQNLQDRKVSVYISMIHLYLHWSCFFLVLFHNSTLCFGLINSYCTQCNPADQRQCSALSSMVSPILLFHIALCFPGTDFPCY